MNEIIKEFEQSEAGKAFRCLLLEVDETIQKDVKEKTLKFLITKLKEERIKTLEEVKEKFEYLKQCANGQKFPYWDLDERPSLIIQEIDNIINNLKN
jgi:hypothetical protein